MIQLKNFSVENKYEDLDLKIDDGQIVCLVGANGSGKSLLAKFIFGIYANYQGDIIIDQQIMNNQNYQNLQNKLSIIYQNPYLQFIGETVLDELVYRLEQKGLNKKQIKIKIAKLNYSDKKLNQKLITLSAGEAQKVLIDGNLIDDVNNLFLDENLSNLSNLQKQKIFKELKAKKLAVIYVTNNQNDVKYADVVYQLQNKKIKVYQEYNHLEVKIHPNTNPVAITINNFQVKYQLKKLNLEFNYGLNLLIGENGAGKTTIFKAITGFVKYQGTIKLNSKQISYLSQNPFRQIIAVTVKQQLLLSAQNIEQILNSFEKFRIDQKILNSELINLSSGELIQVMLIEIILKQSKIILIDESFEVLDKKHRQLFIEEFSNSQKRVVICITHNLEIFANLAANIINLSD